MSPQEKKKIKTRTKGNIMNDSLKSKINEYKDAVNKKLDEYLKVQYPEEIWDSMRYSVLSGGKRIRPLLVLETCNALSGNYLKALPVACAIEMLHSQSLIHDDLPCMDNDDYRRGKLTNHKVFGESTAVLAGDALLSFAPQIILQHTKCEDSIKLKLLEEFFISAGAEKLIAGQVVDIASEGKQIDKNTLDFIHKNKTGALFCLSVRSGAMIAGADGKTLENLTEFAKKIGLAFQISDDILDETATLETLGKTPHKDKQAGKVTYLSFYGMEEAKKRLDFLCSSACDILEKNKINSDILREITLSINERVK